ncbi:hypothetical protein [Serratia nevei]|uniref:hypothetical protein n=1 Tax=Serratia nevei TaxID=2703794 RepID=UPI00313E42A9
MTNLSELSKPVAWTDERGNLCTTRNKERGLESRYHQDYEKYTTPFYSQEYVSALLAELEAKGKRITTVTEESEFWRERVDGAEKEREEFRRRFNLERSCLEDADKRIAELEAKLATPVRLPRTLWYEHDDLAHEIPVLEKEKVVTEIRAAGFKVEGDE